MSEAAHEVVRIGVVSISDRASSGVYEDKGLPALQDWLGRAVRNPIAWVPRLIPDERAGIAATLRELVDEAGCHLVLTTGGTGPAPRDVTPESITPEQAIELLAEKRAQGPAKKRTTARKPAAKKAPAKKTAAKK